MSATRVNWLDLKRELSTFRPELTLASNDTATAKATVTRTLQLFLNRQLRSNAEIVEAMNDWRTHVQSAIGPQLYSEMLQHEDTPDAIALRSIIYRYGPLVIMDNEHVQQMIIDERPQAVRNYIDSSLMQQRIEEAQAPREQEREQVRDHLEQLEGQLAQVEASLLTPQQLERLQMTRDSDERDFWRALSRYEDLLYNPTYVSYLSYLDQGKSDAQARYYLRSQGIDQVLQQIAEAETEANALEDIMNQSEQRLQEQSRAESERIALTQQIKEATTDLDTFDDVIPLTQPEVTQQQLRYQLHAFDQDREALREDLINDAKHKKAHNKEEYMELLRDHSDVDSNTPVFDVLARFRDEAPMNMERINNTLNSVDFNTRIDISNFTNEERDFMKERLIERIEDLFKSISANDVVQIRLGRGDVIRHAPIIRTKEQALTFIRSWTEEGFIIQYDEETHIALTDGDRETVAPMFTVDWFEIVVNHGTSASGGGYPKWYYNGTDEETLKALKRYQITDHVPVKEDTDITTPCLIHVILQMDWTDVQKKKVKDLLYSRVKYVHVSAADAAKIFNELNIEAIIHDYDNRKIIEYPAPTQKPKPKKLEICIINKHYMMHDEGKCYKLISKLIHEGTLVPLSYYDARIFNRPLIEHEAEVLYSYAPTSWKEPAKIKIDVNSTSVAFKGFSLIVQWMIDKGINVLADSGVIKQFMRKSIRGANVAIASSSPMLIKESVTSLDFNAFYWFCMREINVGVGLPKSIPSTMTIADIMELVHEGAIVFVECEYDYNNQHALDRRPKAKVLTNYDLLCPQFAVKSIGRGFYWSGAKVVKKPFAPFIDKMYHLRQTNKELKRLLNAGIGMLIHKWRPVSYKKISKQHPVSANFNYLGIRDDKEVWANAVDYEYNFTQLHSLILSYANYYLQSQVFHHCKLNSIHTYYTSTDSLTIRTADVKKMEAFMSETELGKMKVEAQGPNAIFIRRGVYYINDNKYASLNVPHARVEEYCSKHKMSLAEFFKNMIDDGTLLNKC